MSDAAPRLAPDILALGEAMIEFNHVGEGGARLYLQGFGGDTSNFAIAAARQGARVAYLSALGDDAFAGLLRDLWTREAVDHSAVATDPQGFTAVYVVTHDQHGHHFDFLRRGSAASRMRPEDLVGHRFEGLKVLHYSGISLAISTTARDTCFAAVDAARAAGARISFDTNLRLKLWPLEQAREAIDRAIAASDICLPSLEDMVSLTGLHDASAIARHCLARGAGLVALKMGSQGALLAADGWSEHVPPHPCTALDATGAGDTFGGAFVARLLAGDRPLEAARYANVAAALSTQGYGAVDPIPKAAQVRAALAAGA